jgi:hypothetical protein
MSAGIGVYRSGHACQERGMTEQDKGGDAKPFLTLSDQFFGRNLNAAVAQIGMAAVALAAIYAACRLLDGAVR